MQLKNESNLNLYIYQFSLFQQKILFTCLVVFRLPYSLLICYTIQFNTEIKQLIQVIDLIRTTRDRPVRLPSRPVGVHDYSNCRRHICGKDRRPSVVCAGSPRAGGWGWSLAQLTLDTRRGTSWTTRQFTAGLTFGRKRPHTLTFTHRRTNIL